MVIGSFKRHILGNVLYAVMTACALVTVAGLVTSAAGIGDSWMAALVLHSQASELAALPWTPLTYAFVHSDLMHLLLNMLWLYAFGRIMLGYATQRRLAAVLAGGALCGAVCFLSVYTLCPGLGPASLLGSSAAVLAVATATAVDVPDLPLRMWVLGEVRLKWIVTALVALFCIGLTGSAASTAAHAGGAAFGILAGLARRRRRTQLSAEAMHSELDTLLHKVRTSGYEALSARDRHRLFELSYKTKR